MSAKRYLAEALRVVQSVVTRQSEAIEQAGAEVARALRDGRKLWAFGTGHSHMIAEEIYSRAGGLDGVGAVLEPSLMLHEGPQKSSQLERLPGLAAVLLGERDIGRGDVVVVASNSGRNAVPVEFAEQARERGATVVAVTSLAHSTSVPSRAPSGRRLCEVADIVIDNCGAPGDAAVDLPDGQRVGATSTVTGALIVQAIVCEAADRLVAAGITPPVLRSFNVDASSASA